MTEKLPGDITQPKAIVGDVSPTLHPDSALPWTTALKDVPAYQSARNALGSLYSGMSDMEAADQTTRKEFANGVVVDGKSIRTEIPEERKVQLAADLGERFGRVARSFDQHLATVTETTEKLQATIARTLTSPKTDAVTAQAQSDIRRFVKDHKNPMDFLHSAINDGDHEVVSAVLGTTGWVSGLNRENVETIRDLASKRFAPVEYAQHAAAKALGTHLQNASKIFVTRYRAIAPVLRTASPQIAAIKKLKEA